MVVGSETFSTVNHAATRTGRRRNETRNVLPLPARVPESAQVHCPMPSWQSVFNYWLSGLVTAHYTLHTPTLTCVPRAKRHGKLCRLGNSSDDNIYGSLGTCVMSVSLKNIIHASRNGALCLGPPCHCAMICLYLQV